MRRLDQRASAAYAYDHLAPDDAVFVREAAERIRARGRHIIAEIAAIGQELRAVKRRLQHGRFGAWLAVEFSMSQDTAERYMQVADLVAQNPRAAEFGGSLMVLYKLASPGTPEPVRTGVLNGFIKPTTVAIDRAITAASVDPAARQALREDLTAAAKRSAAVWQQGGMAHAPSTVEPTESAYPALVQLWPVSPTPTTLAATLVELMALIGSKVEPDVEALARGVALRPELRVVAHTWISALRAALDVAADSPQDR